MLYDAIYWNIGENQIFFQKWNGDEVNWTVWEADEIENGYVEKKKKETYAK